jgi:uncharacterized protein DUF982
MRPDKKRRISPPVGVWVAKRQSGVVRVVGSLFDAADVLHFRWPAEFRGRRWKTAARTCLAAYEGKVAVDVVRNALVAAAEEAGILRHPKLRPVRK